MTIIDDLCSHQKEVHSAGYLLIFIVEHLLGKTDHGSTFGFIKNMVMRPTTKGDAMELGKLHADYKDGSILISYPITEGDNAELKLPAKALVKPALMHLKEQIDSGAIDPIKGTDLDKEVMDRAIAALLAL